VVPDSKSGSGSWRLRGGRGEESRFGDGVRRIRERFGERCRAAVVAVLRRLLR
jgi:hypothetical protein